VAQRRINWIRVFMIAVPVAVAVALLAPYGGALFQSPTSGAAEPPLAGPMRATPFLAPGIERPQLVAAADAALADDDDVIGVVVNNRPRAYRLKALTATYSHVVNDLIDKVPVTVTYCNMSDTVQAFTSPSRGDALDIWTVGWNNQLILKAGPVAFSQRTGKMMDSDRNDEMAFPLFPFERVSWKAWRSAYPETEVYVGEK